MPVQKLNPYLNFNGEAESAIKLYESALGAKTESLMRWSEGPGMNIPEENKNRIMHATLKIGNGMLMLADGPAGPSEVSNGHIILEYSDTAEENKAFEALSAGGKITMPLQDTFWGARFGQLTDKFGVRWMFNCPLKAA